MPKAHNLYWSCGILFLAAVCAGCDQGPRTTDWIRFSPPGGGFSVLMPTKPLEAEPKGDEEFQAKTFRIVTAMSDVAAMAVSYADQPNRSGMETDPTKILKAVADLAVTNQRGKLLTEKKISIQNHPGLEITMEIGGGYSIRQRIYLVNKRLISVMVTAGSKGLISKEANKLFESFRLR